MRVTTNPAQAKTSTPATTNAVTTTSQQTLSNQTQTEINRTKRTGKTEILVSAEATKTLKDAVNRVVLLYAYAFKGDVQEFIEAYIYRPVATMTNIFGSEDLKIEAVEQWSTKLVRVVKHSSQLLARVAQKLLATSLIAPGAAAQVPVRLAESTVPLDDNYLPRVKYVKKQYKETTYKVTAGTEGFHSRAFSDQDNLFGLVGPKVKKILGLTRQDEKLLAKLDTRSEKREAVRKYAAALLRSQGVLA